MNLSLSNFLTKPGVNKFVAEMDDQEKMLSVFVRDMVDVGGRVSVAAKRSPKYELPEVALEQTLTSIVWCFGIRWCKNLYNAIIRKSGGKIKLPEINDLSLINVKSLSGKGKQVGKETVQQLTHADIDRYAADDVKKHLQDVLANKNGLKKLYRNSAMLKFVLATMLPSVAIGFGLPSIKQAYTRKILAKQKAQEQAKAFHQKQLAALTGGPYFYGIDRPDAFSVFNGDGLSSGDDSLKSKLSAKGFSPSNGKPQFGVMPSLMNLTSKLLLNEQANTMLVDLTISGGRTIKARNWAERLEVLYQESTLIFFAFFALSPLQKMFQAGFDKWMNTNGNLHFKAFNHILKRYKDADGKLDQQAFRNDWQQVRADIKEIANHNVKIQKLKDKLKNTPKSDKAARAALKSQIGELSDAFEKKWAKNAREFVLETKTNGQVQKNLIMEMADAANAMPTRKAKDGKVYNRLTAKVNTDKIKQVGLYLDDVFNKKEAVGSVKFNDFKELTEKQAKEILPSMNKYLKKSLKSRFGSLALGMGVCSLFMGIIVPRTKQLITQKMTGKDQFPGLLNDGQREGLFKKSQAA